MASIKRVLFISSSPFIGGAEKSLFQFLDKCNDRSKYVLTFSKTNCSIPQNIKCPTYYLPLNWLCKTINPFKIFYSFYSIVLSTFLFIRIVRKHHIRIIYANTIKSSVYGVILKIFTKSKMIWHVRDNLTPTLPNRFLIRNCDRIISSSKHIYDQFSVNLKNNILIYAGLNIKYWSPSEKIMMPPPKKRKDSTSVTADSVKISIAYIAQFTKWKNHKDFIMAAKIILETQSNIRFLIVGDDLSGREKHYKAELKLLVKKLNLTENITFYGHTKDIRKLINQIDILMHPAINEPFGRAIIEAMSMEKPVVAYNCGGPKEIIENGQTGFVVKPYDYKKLAGKTIELIENKELRIKMGKSGRQKVIKKFNIERYVYEMEKIFDSI